MQICGDISMTADDKRFDFNATLEERHLTARPISIATMWINITRLCNQACAHCHVDASPNRSEQMNRRTIDRCLEILSMHESIKNLDITGGAPELNPHFEYFVTEAGKLKKHVIVRHNLTVILDGNPQAGEKMAHIPQFFAENQVEVLASLPHYQQCFTDEIRGNGVFEKSIEGIRLLNEQGYGRSVELMLNLVCNCEGPVVTSERAEIEDRFKRELLSRYGLVFNRLLTVTNMPINRFKSQLQKSGRYHEYMRGLSDAFSADAVQRLVCRSLISVGWDGKIYDCDFNQMLDMQVVLGVPATVFNFDLEALMNRQIQCGSHCFGCTAGGGSS
jgi:radical SAM/Cys-rich protein